MFAGQLSMKDLKEKRLRRVTTRSLAPATVAVVLLGARFAGAAEEPRASGTDGAGPERTWLFQENPVLPEPLRVVALSRMTYTATGNSPTRPFAANLSGSGAMFELGGEVGLLPALSLTAVGVAGESGRAGGIGAMGATAGVRLSIFPASWRATHAVVAGGYLRELSGENGAWGRLTVSQDIGPARLTGTLHGEHVFVRGRDDVDVLVMAGASYRIVGPFRAGMEYVGQDLEGAFDGQEAEGGIRHFLGATASAVILERVSLVAGPAVGLSYASPRILGRAAIAYAF